MVHTYECLGKFFLLDVESGSVFEVDELTSLLIQKRISPEGQGDFSRFAEGENGGLGNTLDSKRDNSGLGNALDVQAEIDKRLSFFSVEEIAEAEAEIDLLVAEGVLFSEFQPVLNAKGSGVIKALCLNITHDCNLRCTYCFADGGSYKGARAHMSIDTARAAVDFLIGHSGGRRNLEIDFFGGEPILNFDVIKETVAYAKERGGRVGKNFRFTVTTNALLLSKEHIDFFNAEMYNVVLSIDGRREVHDRHRVTAGGKGSYDTVLKNALCFKNQRSGQYYVRGTYTAKNLDFCEDVLELNDLGFDQISVEPVVLDGADPLALKAEHLPEIFSQYEKLAAEYLKRRKNGQELYFFHFNVDLGGGSLCESKRLKGCGAGCEYVAIAPSGDIYPCHQFDGESAFRMGNVKETNAYNAETNICNSKETTCNAETNACNLKETTCNSKNVDIDPKISAMFEKSSVLTKPACAGCWAKYYCSGGCNAANIKYAGGIDNVCEISCKIMKKRLECAIAVNSIEKSGG